MSAPRYNIEICRTTKNVYVQFLGPFSMEMQTIENLAKNLKFQACEKVFVCTYNISIKILEYELRKFYLVMVAMVGNQQRSVLVRYSAKKFSNIICSINILDYIIWQLLAKFVIKIMSNF